MTTIVMYTMAFLYAFAGVFHFLKPRFFLAIMPPFVPAHQLMVALSGAAEILLAIGLLFPQTCSLAAWGIIVLLLAVFPANIYMATSGKFTALPQWALYLRLPLQFVLIWWAYQYTQA